MKLVFEKSILGRRGIRFPECDVPRLCDIPDKLKRKNYAELPELSELDIVRHFTRLSRHNMGVDTNFYPLGSCTMKYNPKICEEVVLYKGLGDLHPLIPQLPNGNKFTQGALQVLYETSQFLSEITGMAEFTMQPLAGAHGELTGTMMIAAYHASRGQKRKKIIIPDSAHGTNPASATIAGYEIVSIPSNAEGVMDIDEFKKALDKETAAVMLTCPNTLGLFNSQIKEIADRTHEAGGLMYYDGANLNAILGKLKPGDVGFDIVHVNLHKTFGTPHGGGGPGSGPVGVKENLVKFLPISRVVKKSDETYALEYNYPSSIGYVAPFYGNFGVILKAYVYILLVGKEGLAKIAENSVLNANYIMKKLKPYYHLPYVRICMHEFVISAIKQKKKGVRAIDIAKRLLDFGFHAPTVYFPAIVEEAIMIEPTETESKQTIDKFIDIMIKISKETDENPEIIKTAPHNLDISRLDEVKAAREPRLRWTK